jgi:uncharacterized protein (TIGR03000 family)
MLRRLVPFLGTSALALAAFLVVTEPVAAQRREGREGSSYGNSRGSVGREGYNSGWSGGRWGYNSWGYSPWYGANLGVGVYPGGYSPYYSQNYGFRYAPETYGYDGDSNFSPLRGSYRNDGRVAEYAPVDESVVHINVRVSANAEIWFDGAKTTQTGSLRQFVSAPIASEGECSYEIRARWTEGGREIDRTRKVSFHAGDQFTVNFMTRRSNDANANGQRDARTQTSPAAEESGQPATRDQDQSRSSAPVAKNAGQSTHDGKVVSIVEDKLVMTGKDDQEHSHALTADVKMTCDATVCKFENIKAGMRIRVSTNDNDTHSVTRIEALDKNDNFEKRNNY